MNDIIIYPSSWYYNACVQGFLEVLAWGLGEDGNRVIEEHILQEDGRAIIPGNLAEAIFGSSNIPMPAVFRERRLPVDISALRELKRIVWWWVEASFEQGFIRGSDREKGKKLIDQLKIVDTVCYSLFNQKSYYPNLMQITSWSVDKKIDFLNNWFGFNKVREQGAVKCSFCGWEYEPDAKARIYDTFFTLSLSRDLGNGPAVFPNLFWDGKPNLTVCKACRSYFLCFHLIHRRKYFVNSDSLQINWHLNRLLAGKVKQSSFVYQGVLLDSLLYDSQLRRGIGGWGLQNLEVLVFDRNGINYYPISTKLAKMFLVPRISVLMGKVTSQKVWDLILKENFSYLPTIIYKSLRAYLSGSGGNSGSNPEVVLGSSKNIQPIIELIDLYYEIIKYVAAEESGKVMGYINLKELRELAANAPLTQDDNLVFRLLELTRLNRKADVYHLLLRLYVARNVPFPDELAQVFTVSDIELFKTGVYAYISGLRPSDQDVNQ